MVASFYCFYWRGWQFQHLYFIFPVRTPKPKMLYLWNFFTLQSRVFRMFQKSCNNYHDLIYGVNFTQITCKKDSKNFGEHFFSNLCNLFWLTAGIILFSSESVKYNDVDSFFNSQGLCCFLMPCLSSSIWAYKCDHYF